MNRLSRYPAYYDLYMTKKGWNITIVSGGSLYWQNVIETNKHIDKTEKVHTAELGYYGAFTAVQQILH